MSSKSSRVALQCLQVSKLVTVSRRDCDSNLAQCRDIILCKKLLKLHETHMSVSVSSSNWLNLPLKKSGRIVSCSTIWQSGGTTGSTEDADSSTRKDSGDRRGNRQA